MANFLIRSIHQRLANVNSIVVAQLVERSLPTPEVRGLNPAIGKIYIEQLLSTVLKIEAGNGPFLETNVHSPSYHVAEDDQCVISAKGKQVCKKCRYIKCLSIGMNPKFVLTDSEKRTRFEKFFKKKDETKKKKATKRRKNTKR